MTRAINLYSLSRIHEEAPFNALDKHMSQKETLPRTKSHEIESLRFLTDQLLRCGVSLREVDGCYEVGIHIADVSHYIPFDSPLDRFARDRSTSV